MKYTITLLPGDGIGPEVMGAAVRVVDSCGLGVSWEPHIVGQEAIERFQTPLPPEVLDSVRKNRVALKGPVTTPIGKGFGSVNVLLRRELELYANLRPVRTLPGVRSRYSGVDLVIVRENTEGLYSGIEHRLTKGVVASLKVATEAACLRISRFGFAYARKHGRKKVTAIHKANIMKLTDGLFLDCARLIAPEYPEIQYEEKIIDNAAMQLILNPAAFDVLLNENLYGDIISEIGAGLVGGLGVVPGANIGEESAVFEAVHGSAPDIAGQNRANPVAAILSAALMLEYLGEHESAQRITAAVHAVLAEGRAVTADLGGKATTTEMTDAVLRSLERAPAAPHAAL
jgi:isocitrate dehydrogenase (NAD+)